MRTAIVKQLLDTLGPWATVRWTDTSPEGIFKLWPGRGMHYEMTTLLRADWYVVPQQRNTDYTYDSVLKQKGRAEILRKYTKRVVEISEILFDSYDLVISTDPIFRFPAKSETLFAYFLAEHWDWRYAKSLRRPLENADLFLAHMMDAPTALSRLPQAVAFPYLRDPRTMRAVFSSPERDEAVWADWRTLATLGTAENTHEHSESAAQRLEEALGIKVARRSYSMGLYYGEDPPRWGDTAKYFRQLGKQKYYLCLGRAGGAGQGLGDAASLGCVCFGEQDKAYHRLLCHRKRSAATCRSFPAG